MIDKPEIANYAMSTRGRILTKTIMEIVDRSKIIRNGLRSLEWPYVIALPGKDQESYYHYNIEDPELICKGWFLPPNTYDCGSFVVNGTAVVGKESKKSYNRWKSTQKGADLYEIDI